MSKTGGDPKDKVLWSRKKIIMVWKEGKEIKLNEIKQSREKSNEISDEISRGIVGDLLLTNNECVYLGSRLYIGM